MQGPVARLTTADPEMPRAGHSPGLESRAGRLEFAILAQRVGSTPHPTAFSLGIASPNTQDWKLHTLWSLARKPQDLPYFRASAQAAFYKTGVGENENQCQILARQKNNCCSPQPPLPALAWWAGEMGPSPAVEDLFILHSIKGNQALSDILAWRGRGEKRSWI